MTTVTKMTTVRDVLVSLENRGFYNPHNGWVEMIDLLRVMLKDEEERGELARLLYRLYRHGDKTDRAKLTDEAADAVVTAIHRLGILAGSIEAAEAALERKVSADETRGYQHRG